MQSDTKLARILSRALEEKFVSDLGLSEGQPSESEVISSIESWVSSTVQKDAQPFFWDDVRNTAPYAVLFVLFLCGHHKLGLRYLKEYVLESHL